MISLGKDEELVYVLKKHWGCLVVPLIATIFTTVLRFRGCFIGWQGIITMKSL